MREFPIVVSFASLFFLIGCGSDGAPSDPKPADPSKAPVLKQMKEGGSSQPKTISNQK